MAPNDKNKQSLLRPVWNLLGNINSQIKNGKFFQDVGMVKDLIKTAANGGAQNDREFLLERMVGVLSTIPVGRTCFTMHGTLTHYSLLQTTTSSLESSSKCSGKIFLTHLSLTLATSLSTATNT